MKKAKLSVVLLLTSSTLMLAQTINDAIKLTSNEQFEAAEAVYKSLIQSQPNNGEYYFYYGENYFKNDNIDMANSMYQKGVEVNATNPLPYVGLGKVQWYKGQQAEAKANFYKATTFAAGKNAIVLWKIAEAYIHAETKNIPEALNLLSQAAKIDPKKPEIFLAIGDAYLEQNDGNKAIENYEKAAALDPKSVGSLLRQGQLYNRAKNYTLALDLYKKASLIDSTFAPAYREKAEIYFRAGQYNAAVAQYKKYLQLNNSCSARVRFAGFLNQAKQYKESRDAALEAQKCAPTNNYLNRYLAYDYFELKDFPNGLASINAFFAKVPPEKIIGQDYETRAKLNAQFGNDSLAIIDFKKALEADSTRKELSSDIANSLLKMKKYPEAIEMYKKRVADPKANANDWMSLGKAYYFSKDFINADSAFAHVVTLLPDVYQGYIWRAKASVQMDPQNKNWLAKSYYEQFISKVKPEEADKVKSYLIEAYNYLGAYYADAARKDCPNVKLYFQKLLDIDPTNAQAKKVLAGLKC